MRLAVATPVLVARFGTAPRGGQRPEAPFSPPARGGPEVSKAHWQDT